MATLIRTTGHAVCQFACGIGWHVVSPVQGDIESANDLLDSYVHPRGRIDRPWMMVLPVYDGQPFGEPYWEG